MKIRPLKYLIPVSLYVLAFLAFTQTGAWCWLPVIYAWVIIPVTELLIKPDKKNMDAAEEEMARADKLYDYILYTVIILIYPMLYLFLRSMQEQNLAVNDIAGRVWTMGLICGTFGINVGHELGHRVNSFEQSLAKAGLLSSMYTHFFIEHNKGHHKNVATPEDPSSARLHEPVYLFYFRTIIFSYISAWKIANADAHKKNKPAFSLYNEMLQLQLLQLVFLSIIIFVFGWKITLFYLCAAAIGFLLLETVNYIEHYGLSRKKKENGNYERAMPQHSWNSNHVAGRLMLFELSRHSDHHYLASRKYQVLRNHEEAPQMPTGYPGMMILSLVPPLWFYVMHKQMKKYEMMGEGKVKK